MFLKLCFVVKLTGAGFQRDSAGDETTSFSRPDDSQATPGIEAKEHQTPTLILFCAGKPRQSESVVEVRKPH